MNKTKNFLKKFFFIDDTPHKVAAGAALGLFMGILPGGIITTLVLASIFRFNRLSALISSVAFSFWSTALVLPPAAALGGFLFGIKAQDLAAEFEKIQSGMDLTILISHQIWPIFLKLALPLAAGLIIIAAILSLIFYYLLYYFLKNNKLRFTNLGK